MKNEWIVIEIAVPGRSVDLVSALMADSGSEGIVVEERQLDAFIPPDDELEPDGIYRLKVYFRAVEDPDLLVSELTTTLNSIPSLANQKLEIALGAKVRVEDWSESWKQNFSPFRVGERLVVCPSWDRPEVASDDVVIEIDPGMAFGTGAHATTRLCLDVIAELMAGSPPPAGMLDVGTGSGLLALGASALGCGAVTAIDIDPVACEVARKNIEHNDFQDRVLVSEDSLELLQDRFALVVANILAEENVRLGQALFEHMLPGGWLVLSGILKEKEGLVRDAFAKFPLEAKPSRYLDEWVCLVYRRNE